MLVGSILASDLCEVRTVEINKSVAPFKKLEPAYFYNAAYLWEQFQGDHHRLGWLQQGKTRMDFCYEALG